MTWTGDLFMGPDAQETSEPRVRLAKYLRQKFPTQDGYAAKRLSKAIGCTPKAAENFLDGHWPNSRHWGRIAALFGKDVLDIVFGPDINATVDRLRQEEVRLERQLLEIRARRLETEGPLDRADQRLEATADRTVVDLPREGRSFASTTHRKRI
jgi:hypothetical protein